MRTVLACTCALALAVAPAQTAVAEDPPPGSASQDADRARRQAEEREEQERRLALERQEQARNERLTEALEKATGDLAAAEAALISAVANDNRARGDLVVARYDLEEARERFVDSQERLGEAERALDEATAELAVAADVLASEAAAAYRAGSTSQTAPMLAMEAIVRARTPGEFAAGVSYLNAVLGGRLEQHRDAERAVKRWTAELVERRKARALAEEAVAAGEDAVAAAQADAARQQARLRGAFAAHAARTGRLSAYADGERKAAAEADVPRWTPGNVALATDIAELAAAAAEAAERLRNRSARIVGGQDGVRPWRDFRCPLDGPVQFVNDWGFPRSDGRSHEGTDLFARRGTPVVAMADGIVDGVSRHDVGLGGLTVTYTVDDHRIYNAHLSAVADGLEAGAPVHAGQVIGTVGTSGNARGTPPHNHLGVYRPDGAPVNPYPIVRLACR